jgi:predicted house-cleaning noncanonical NTP pyrophosphatase (MazG superfamily)
LWLQYGKEEPKVKLYNKLVKDKIPEVIKKRGKSFIVRQVKDDEKFTLLKEKLTEEVQEFFQDENLEELADIMEVLYNYRYTKIYFSEDRGEIIYDDRVK